jgi:HEPN domain-containing protein
MTPQREEALRLLRLARRDKDTFDLLLPLPAASIEALGFHAQQSVEKALKALAALNGLPLRRTHDLVALGQVLVEHGLVLPVSEDQLRSLNPFAVEFRYDDEAISYVNRQELASTLQLLLGWAQTHAQ